MKKFLVLLLSMSFCFAGPECANFKSKEYENGLAVIRGTKEESPIKGLVTFKDTPEGLEIQAVVDNLPPGKHGFHIHEFGSMGNEGKDAGGHYNPMRLPHGFTPKDGVQKVHAGDLGNIVADETGHAELKIKLPHVHLNHGEFNVAGRGMIIHEKEDDFSQPVGNAGARIAGGSIIIVD